MAARRSATKAGAAAPGAARGRLRVRVLAALADAVPGSDPARLDPGRAFRDQLEIDSLDFLRFVQHLEQALGLQVPDLDFPRLASLEGALAYLEERLGRVRVGPGRAS